MYLESETPVDIHEQSPLNLAFVGDGVLELLVRRRDLKFWLTSRREQKAAEAPRRRSARTEAPERHFAAKH